MSGASDAELTSHGVDPAAPNLLRKPFAATDLLEAVAAALAHAFPAESVRAHPLPALASRLRAVLGDDLVGLYLYGSLVSGGLDPGVSDLDLVAVTTPAAGDLDLPALERLHVGLVRGHPAWADRIEVVYVGRHHAAR